MTKHAMESPETEVSPRVAGPAVRPDYRPAADAPSATLWTVADVAAYLKLPRSAIYKMTARAAIVRIPHVRLGGLLRFRQVDIDRWLVLLTHSNIDALARTRDRAQQVIHGHHSSAPAR